MLLWLAIDNAVAQPQFNFRPVFPSGSNSSDLEGVSLSSIAFADVDADNDPDLLITGWNGSNATAKLYTNDGKGNFTEKTTGTPFEGVEAGSIAFADVGGDSDPDVFITGFNTLAGTTSTSLLYINEKTPVFASGSSSMAEIPENTTNVLTVMTDDEDAGAVITYSISGGADRALFSIDANSEALTFITAPDFEGSSADGDDDYEVIVTVSDGTNSVVKTITVTVTRRPY